MRTRFKYCPLNILILFTCVKQRVAIYDNDSRIRKPLAAFYKSTLENYFLILLYLSQKFSFEMNQIGDNLTLLSRFLFEA